MKVKLAAARQEERRKKLRQEQGKTNKKKKTIKYLKIGAAVGTTALSIASCVVNPFNVGSAVTHFVHLANLVFSGSKSSSLMDETNLQSDDDSNDGLDYDGGDLDC